MAPIGTVKLVPFSAGIGTFDLRMEFHRDTDSVRQVEQAISEIRGPQQPEVWDQPQADWCVV